MSMFASRDQLSPRTSPTTTWPEPPVSERDLASRHGGSDAGPSGIGGTVSPQAAFEAFGHFAEEVADYTPSERPTQGIPGKDHPWPILSENSYFPSGRPNQGTPGKDHPWPVV